MAPIGPGAEDLHSLQGALHRSSGELRQAYETLLASDALTSLASRDPIRDVLHAPQPSTRSALSHCSPAHRILSDRSHSPAPSSHFHPYNTYSTRASTQPTPRTSPLSTTFPPPEIYRPTSQHYISHLHTSESYSPPNGRSMEEDDEAVFKKPKVESEFVPAKTALASLLN
jgi:hypothetical protein